MALSELIPPNTPLNENLVSSITAAFDEANIDSVLWGDCLLTLFGVPSGLDDIAFVVPDGKVAAAYAVLTKLGFRECALYRGCRTLTSPGFAPCPTSHLHIDGPRFIGLYKKSNMLWNLPSLRAGLSGNSSIPDVITASDPTLPGPRPGRGRGAFSQGLHPVHIPSAHRLTEAYILLTLRDWGKPIEFFWRAMLTYIGEFLLEDGILDMRGLEPHHRRFIEHFTDPRGMGMAQVFDELRSASM